MLSTIDRNACSNHLLRTFKALIRNPSLILNERNEQISENVNRQTDTQVYRAPTNRLGLKIRGIYFYPWVRCMDTKKIFYQIYIFLNV